MSRFIAAVIAFVGLLLLIAFLLPMVVPTHLYKPRLEEQATAAAGRPVRFGDDIKIRFLPNTAFSVTDLVVESPEGFEAPTLLTAERADIGVKILPLLSRRVEINRFVVETPTIALERRADGAVNWAFDTPSAPTDDTDTDAPQPDELGVGDVRLGDVRIVNGSASYKDAVAAADYSATDINLAVRLERFAEPLEADGTLTLQGAPARVSLILTTIDALRRSQPANLKLDAALDDAELGADLALTQNEGAVRYQGPVSLNAPDLGGLAALFGAALEDAPGFDALAAKGKVDGDAEGLRLEQAEITFDEIDAAGDLSLDWSGAKPKATGALSTPSLDLRPYLPAPTQNAEGFPAWSEDKLDFASLRNIDADLDLSADSVFLNDIKTGEARMKLVIQNGRLAADIPQLRLYGGGGSGRLVVNARKARPSFAGYFDMRSVKAEPFSKDFLKHDKLLGLGAMRFEFSAAGASQAAIMRSLDGKGGFDIDDGAVKGFNIVKLANAVREIYEGGGNPAAISAAIAEARRPNEQTDFSKFLSNFTITNGAVSAPTISMEGPFFDMAGRGSVNLPGQTVDLRLAPTVSPKLDRSGRRFMVPVKIGGSFSQPSVAVDYESLLQGAVEKKGLELLDQVFGGDKSSDATSSNNSDDEGDADEEPAETILRGLFERALQSE
ncbi:MAG: AsmA family protein [Pseudomonadota bacterium]